MDVGGIDGRCGHLHAGGGGVGPWVRMSVDGTNSHGGTESEDVLHDCDVYQFAQRGCMETSDCG